jgi:GTPase Era involved in 16S rRNA processing
MTFGIGEAIAVVELTITAREQGWFDKLLSVFKKKQRVLVFGATGVGKTQLLETLSTGLANIIDLMDRTQFVETKHIKIGNQPFVFLDTPGQKQHVAHRKTATREQLRKGSFGIINVVSYGYHESKSVDGQNMITVNGVDPQFLQQQRKIELKQLNEWVVQTDDPTRVAWILTVVSKADLWWDHREIVLKHYESGEYHKKLKALSDVPHQVVANCSCNKKFFNIAPMSGYFEDSDNMRLKANLLQTLLRLAAKR